MRIGRKKTPIKNSRDKRTCKNEKGKEDAYTHCACPAPALARPRFSPQSKARENTMACAWRRGGGFWTPGYVCISCTIALGGNVQIVPSTQNRDLSTRLIRLNPPFPLPLSRRRRRRRVLAPSTVSPVPSSRPLSFDQRKEDGKKEMLAPSAPPSIRFPCRCGSKRERINGEGGGAGLEAPGSHTHGTKPPTNPGSRAGCDFITRDWIVLFFFSALPALLAPRRPARAAFGDGPIHTHT